MATLAWFTPLPPLTSGVAQYNIELLPGLVDAHRIDVFVDGAPDRFARPAQNVSVYSAHDFVWKHFQRPYDLIVYQLGNAVCHDYMWAYLVRYPGLVVLHDGQFHHARALWLRNRGRHDDYRAEFEFNHPGTDPDIAELGIAGLLGAMTYLWPMRRLVVEAARLVVVHNYWLAAQIQEEQPHAQVRVIEMGVPEPLQRPGARESIRARHDIPSDAVVFLSLGKVTPEKRVSQAIRGLAGMAEAVPNAYLLLAGEPVGHYDPVAEAEALGVGDRVKIAGFVPHDEVADHLAAADVCLCMRWPSSRETSASWLRCLAAARPTIITDLIHTIDVPALDPRSWTLLPVPTRAEMAGTDRLEPSDVKRLMGPGQDIDDPQPEEARKPASDPRNTPAREAVSVSIDILDEDHSLRLAMRRLATDEPLRDKLSRSGHALWAERFTLARMIDAYREAIETACALPGPGEETIQRLPGHFFTDGTEHAELLLRRLGLPEGRVADIWKSGPSVIPTE